MNDKTVKGKKNEINANLLAFCKAFHVPIKTEDDDGKVAPNHMSPADSKAGLSTGRLPIKTEPCVSIKTEPVADAGYGSRASQNAWRQVPEKPDLASQMKNKTGTPCLQRVSGNAKLVIRDTRGCKVVTEVAYGVPETAVTKKKKKKGIQQDTGNQSLQTQRQERYDWQIYQQAHRPHSQFRNMVRSSLWHSPRNGNALPNLSYIAGYQTPNIESRNGWHDIYKAKDPGHHKDIYQGSNPALHQGNSHGSDPDHQQNNYVANNPGLHRNNYHGRDPKHQQDDYEANNPSHDENYYEATDPGHHDDNYTYGVNDPGHHKDNNEASDPGYHQDYYEASDQGGYQDNYMYGANDPGPPQEYHEASDPGHHQENYAVNDPGHGEDYYEANDPGHHHDHYEANDPGHHEHYYESNDPGHHEDYDPGHLQGNYQENYNQENYEGSEILL